jgi:hypothetical protein
MKIKLLILILVIVQIALAQSSSTISVQWAVKNPQKFQPVTDWKSIAKKIDPKGLKGLVVDDTFGWIAAIKIGDRIIFACDHYAITTTNGVITSYCWRDDKRWYAIFGAEVCTYSKVVQCIYYGGGWKSNKETDPGALPWSSFIPPAETLTRHGKYVGNWSAHVALWHQQ